MSNFMGEVPFRISLGLRLSESMRIDSTPAPSLFLFESGDSSDRCAGCLERIGFTWLGVWGLGFGI